MFERAGLPPTHGGLSEEGSSFRVSDFAKFAISAFCATQFLMFSKAASRGKLRKCFAIFMDKSVFAHME